MYYEVLADRVRYFKEDKKGVADMCRAMEELCNAARNEGISIGEEENKKEIALRMLQEDILKVEKIAEYCQLTVEEVEGLAMNL